MMDFTILCYATDGWSSVKGRTTYAYGFQIESRYVEPRWGQDIDDRQVHIIS